MSATQTDKASATGKRSLIAVSILGAGLLIASFWFLPRAPRNASPDGAIAPANEAAMTQNVPSDAENERWDFKTAEQRTVPLIQAPVAAPSPIILTNQNHNDAVRLQKIKSKVNQRLVERLKQYVKDHPNLDNRELEEQIKKREAQIQ